MQDLAVVAIAGALGATCRWQATRWLSDQRWAQTRWEGLPVGTLWVNVTGCLLLGLLLSLSGDWLPDRWRLAIGTGFLGSFTTFSTFSAETIGLIQSGTPVVAAVNILLQLGVGLTAAAVGLGLGRLIAQTIG